jgi:hypothetical protein
VKNVPLKKNPRSLLEIVRYNGYIIIKKHRRRSDPPLAGEETHLTDF